MGRKVKNYTNEFKKQIVALNKNGKSVVEIAKEYELLLLRKEIKYLKMENDILKQAAVIIGKK